MEIIIKKEKQILEVEESEEHKIRMPALGRHFLLGDFYNYCTDQHVVAGKPEKATLDINVRHNLNWEFIHATSNEKWEIMGLDEHMQASIAAGLIEKYRGASNYLNDQLVPTQIAHTFALRLLPREESINCSSIYSKMYLLSSKEQLNIDDETTYTVTDIIYGAELYCVLAEDVNNDQEIDYDVRFEIEEKLHKVVKKIEEALKKNRDQTTFKEQFDEKELMQLNRIKCRVYADLQSQAVREMGVFDVYKHCLKLIYQAEDPDVTISTNIIAVVLRYDRHVKPYRDVAGYLIARCCVILDELERVISQLGAFRKANLKANRLSLKQFGEILNKYKDLIRKSLKNFVIEARAADSNDEEIEKIVNIIENHPLFKPAGLKRWLDYKKAESEMADTMFSIAGITFVSDKKQLAKLLSDSFGIKYSLVLNIPPLDEKSNEVLVQMDEYVLKTNLVAMDDEECNDDDPWHMIPRERRIVLEKIEKLVFHHSKNKDVVKETQFLITPGEQSHYCSYSVYQADQLLKGNLSQLPGAPTGLKVRRNSASVRAPSVMKFEFFRLEWEYEELGYPHHFCVEYRSKNSWERWCQQKTEPGERQMTLNFNNGKPMEIRVMADTCIGRSDYSDIVDTEFALDDAE